MKTQIDLKSAACGLALGVFAMLATGAGTSSIETGRHETGRYQVATAGNVALVIDTQTGKVWTKCWSNTSTFSTDQDFSKAKLPELKAVEP